MTEIVYETMCSLTLYRYFKPTYKTNLVSSRAAGPVMVFFFILSRCWICFFRHVCSPACGRLWRLCSTSVWSDLISRQVNPANFLSKWRRVSDETGHTGEDVPWCADIQDKTGIPHIASVSGPSWSWIPRGFSCWLMQTFYECNNYAWCMIILAAF